MSSAAIYIISCIVLAAGLVWSVCLNIKLGITILKIEDSIEECLDIIDERYGSISKVLEIPIFFDSVEVRRVVSDIEETRAALLMVANNLSDPSREKEVTE